MNNGQDFSCFLIDLNNDELNKVLDDITNLIDLKSVVSVQTKESIFTNMLDLIIEAGLSISGLHIAMIISSQIRDKNEINEGIFDFFKTLMKKEWQDVKSKDTNIKTKLEEVDRGLNGFTLIKMKKAILQ